MSEKSNIEWTRSTFNPWWGCTKVGPGCDHCYAEGVGGRFGTQWGTDAERRVFGDKHWNEPLRWEKKAAAEQAVNPKATWRVFCASMADVFDNEAPEGQRERLWALIEATPHLTWLLLTKRIGNAKKMLPAAWLVQGGWPKNVRLGITVVDQEEVDRDLIKLLALQCPNFLSIEPQLGPISMRWLSAWPENAPTTAQNPYNGGNTNEYDGLRRIDWVIVGGESGHGARPMQAEWARTLRDQCTAAGVPFLFKQWGEWAPNWLNDDHGNKQPGTEWMDRMGKRIAGRQLDGVQHDGYPVVQP